MDVTRAATARRLAEDLSRMAALAAELADAEVWRLTRDETAQAIAKALGVSEPAVRKAIQRHNRRQAGLTARTESDKRSRARASTPA